MYPDRHARSVEGAVQSGRSEQAELVLTWRRLPPIHLGLLAAAVALAAFAYLAREQGAWERGALAGALGAACCLVVAVARPLAAERLGGWVDRAAPVVYLLPPLLASATVAIVANRVVKLDHQWWWLALWGASMAAVPLLAGLRVDIRACARWFVTYRWEILAVMAISAVAAAARLVRIDSLPLPYAGDEAIFAISGIQVIEDAISNPFRFGAHGTPSLYFYYVGGMEWLFGDSVTTARASSALLGVVAVPISYVFFRDLFNRTVAITGALFLAAYHYHIQFSRESMPNILDPVFIPLVLLFSYRAIRDGRRLDYALAGLTLGLTIYTWVSARLIPFELAALVGWWIIVKRRLPANWIAGGAIALLAALIAAAPMGWHAYHHPDDFNTRLNQVGIHQAKIGPNGESWFEVERAKGRSSAEIYAKQLKDSFGTVLLTQDHSHFYGARMPLIGTGVLIPLMLALAWAVWKVLEPRYLLALVLFVAPVITGGMLTVPGQGATAAGDLTGVEFAGSAARLLGIIPAVALLVGVAADRVGAGVSLIASRFGWRESRRNALALSVALALVAPLAVASLNFYFRLYDSKGYSGIITVQIEAFGEDVREWVPAGTPVYFLQTDAWNIGHPALNFALRDYPIAVADEHGMIVHTENYRGDLPPIFGPRIMRVRPGLTAARAGVS
jgi:hypothetical protein